MSSNPEIGSLNRTRAIMKEYGIHAKQLLLPKKTM